MKTILKHIVRLLLGLVILIVGVGAIFGIAYLLVQLTLLWPFSAALADVIMSIMVAGAFIFGAYVVGKEFIK